MMPKTNTIYTIGYSGFRIEEFINVLQKMSINIVIDVRSTPVSKYYADYNRDNLNKLLSNSNIVYRNYAEEFGARQEESFFYSKEGYLDFTKFTNSNQFREGFEKIKKAIEANYKIILLCAEKKPNSCHRAIMISREFSKENFNVVHIMPNGILISQNDIEEEMLNTYYPNRNQISFLENTLTIEDMINESYRKRNAEIGYRCGEEEL